MEFPLWRNKSYFQSSRSISKLSPSNHWEKLYDTMSFLTTAWQSPMGRAVLTATALLVFTELTNHQLVGEAISGFLASETVQNVTRAFADEDGVLNITVTNNETMANETFSKMAEAAEAEPTHRERVFWLAVIHFFVVFPVWYWWQLGLERLLPAYPWQTLEIMHEERVESKDANDEVKHDVKRWTSKGKVRKSRISWCNTLSKWILDVTFGSLLFEVCTAMVKCVLLGESFSTISKAVGPSLYFHSVSCILW